MRFTAWIVTAALLLPTTVWAQKSPSPQPQTEEPNHQTGPSPRYVGPVMGAVYVGEGAPDFELDGSEGKAVKLSKFRGDWVLLVFADRKEHVSELRRIRTEVASRGARIVAVCHEKAGSLKSYARRDSVPFLMLSDYNGEIASAYGLYDRLNSQTRPGYLMVDRRGVLRMAVLGQQLPAEHVARFVQYTITGL
jgi:peroxiredoxin